MKVLLLSDTNSGHTEKWARGLAGAGIRVGLFSFNRAAYEWYDHPDITVFFEPEKPINAESMLTKLSYVKYVGILKKIIRHFAPDIVHAHYATSYGFVGALTGFHPLVISVWGSDVFEFPRKSKLHRKLLQYNLKRANLLLSTSEVMREELKRYTSRDVVVTPFGVDTQLFSNRSIEKRHPDKVYVGTIKPIEDNYGISMIISAAAILVNSGRTNFRFLMVGHASDPDRYKKEVQAAGVVDYFEFTGRVPFDRVSEYHNLLDIFLNVSKEESFGVATVEAMSCAKPVIVTDAGGLLEVTGNGRFGMVVGKGDADALAAAIAKLADNPELAHEMGKKARAHVLSNYDWQQNLEVTLEQYRKLTAAQS